MFCWGDKQVVLITVFGMNNTPDLQICSGGLYTAVLKKARLIIISKMKNLK